MHSKDNNEFDKKQKDMYQQEERFLKFKKDMRDCWSVGCICCHRKMSTTAGKYYNGTINDLKAELEEKKTKAL